MGNGFGLHIRIDQDSWLDRQRNSILVLLQDVASHKVVLTCARIAHNMCASGHSQQQVVSNLYIVSIGIDAMKSLLPNFPLMKFEVTSVQILALTNVQ